MHEDILALSPELEPAYVNDDMVIYSFPNRWNENETTDVTIHEKTITVRTIIRHEGLNKYSGKHWTSWTCPYSVIYSLKQQKYDKPILRVYESKKVKGRRTRLFSTVTGGRVQGLVKVANTFQGEHQSRNFNGFQNVSYYYQPRMDGVIENLVLVNLLHKYAKLANLEEDYRPTENNIIAMAYPASRLFPEVANLKDTLHYANGVWGKQNEVRSFLKDNYGKKSVRKDVIKALASMTDANSAVVASYFSKYVPVDWLIPLFTNPQNYYLTSAIRVVVSSKFTPELKKILAFATLPQRKRLLHEPVAATTGYQRTHLLQDVTKLLSEMTPEYLNTHKDAIRFDNWEMLHNSLSILHRRKGMEVQEVPQKGVSKYLDGAKVVTEDNVYIVRTPKINHDLIVWGNTLNNCIASYSRAVVADSTKVFALYTEQDEKLYANLEYRDGRIIQFVTNHNASVPYHVQEAFIKVLKAAERKAAPKKKIKELTAAR